MRPGPSYLEMSYIPSTPLIAYEIYLPLFTTESIGHTCILLVDMPPEGANQRAYEENSK